MKNNIRGFTIIEILIGITIFSVVISSGFYILGAINIGKVKMLESTELTKEISFFSEKLFNEIKNGGSIDYEEYFNRKLIGTGSLNGHYKNLSGFGNYGIGGTLLTSSYGNSFYYCENIFGNGCETGSFQRFGEYAFQFIDYDSNGNGGDEDGDGEIRGDDDDESLGLGPEAIINPTKELYLISGDSRNRTYFRWKWIQDPNKPSSVTCDTTTTGNSYQEGCLGTIQVLKLVGKDWGMNHSKSGAGYNDGIIDTWVIDSDIYGNTTDVIAGSVDMDDYWVDIFPDSLSVKSFNLYLYPTRDRDYAWKDTANKVDVNTYLRLQMTVTTSRKKRVTMKGDIPESKISTTINLSDYFSK